MKTRANLQRIQSLTYVINDENAELLQDIILNFNICMILSTSNYQTKNV